jgi:hypothetical protein
MRKHEFIVREWHKVSDLDKPKIYFAPASLALFIHTKLICVDNLSPLPVIV